MITFTNRNALKFILFLTFYMLSFSDYSQNYSSILFGKFLITPIEIATIKTKLRNETIFEPVNIFLIQTEGKNILIDAGIDSSWNSYKKSHLKTALFFKNYNISNKININDALRQLGLTVDSIHFVILTHSHFDHIYGLSAFKSAQIIMSSNESKAFKWGLINGYLRIKTKDIKHSIKIRFKDDITLKDSFFKSYAFTPNFKILPSFGHTKGHISVLLSDGKDYILFTGDSGFKNKICLQLPVIRFQQSHNIRFLSNHNPITW